MKSIVVVFRELNAPDSKPCEKFFVFFIKDDESNLIIPQFTNEVRETKEFLDESMPDDNHWHDLSWDEKIYSVIKKLLAKKEYSMLHLVKTNSTYFQGVN